LLSSVTAVMKQFCPGFSNHYMKKPLLIIFALLATLGMYAQTPTQKIHGIVTDAQSQSPIPGVTIRLLHSDSLIGTATDVDGNYTLSHVPIGHVSLEFSILGYKPVILNNVILDIGKEGIVNVTMEEYVDTLHEVIVHSDTNKHNPLNDMATVSARAFSPDDAGRYAGSLDDPSRMATNYAGVSVADDTRNDIVIRGNSPLGLLWMCEGIDIPNPNHFGTLGSTGGPVSILNNNTLDKSDFLTGAFPAEYGNALAGVFDLRLRDGNNERAEFTGQIGFNGAELEAEGPLSKGPSAPSYIVDVRYSTLSFFHVLGINYGYAAVPQYEDISFKVDIPMGVKAGRLSIFGLGGPSYIAVLASQQDQNSFNLTPFNENTYFGSTMGVVGISYKYFFNENTSQSLTLAVSGLQNVTEIDTVYGNNSTKVTYGQKSTALTYSAYYTLNKKINSRNTLKFGAMADIYDNNYADSALHDSNYVYGTKYTGVSALLQSYVEWKHKFSETVILNSGLHYQEFTLNNSMAVEPRIGIKWNFALKQSIGLATGLHSEMQPMNVYYYQTDFNGYQTALTNMNLGFSKSAHVVLSYDYAFAPTWHAKVETYYQYLYNIPVQTAPTTYSVLNIGASYYDPPVDSLVNKGTGRNYGAELTIEKYFDKAYYVLVTGSVYQAKYTASDGIERNTAFNGNYTFNALAGGDINLDKSKRKVISISAKVNYAGGKRYVPVDLAESELERIPVYDYSDAYVNRYPDYSRVDLKVSFKLNGKKVTQEWAFEAQNIFNRQNIFQQLYNPDSNSLETDYQLGFFPLGSYKITF